MPTTSMNTITVPSTLEVLDKFECLMKEAVSGESVYIRTKETLNQYFKDSSLSSNDKANAISSILGNMSSSITAAAMQTALQWASTERDLALKKLELAKQLDILDLEKDVKVAQADKLAYESVATQAQTIRLMGTPTVSPTGKVEALSDDGKHWEDIKLTRGQVTKTASENTLLGAKLTETYAGTHRVMADTLVNFGEWSYTLTAGGASNSNRSTITGVEPLSDVQRVIAKEQAKGYTYNAWANAVTASAGMLGTAIASGELDVTQSVNQFNGVLDHLENIELPVGLRPIP